MCRHICVTTNQKFTCPKQHIVNLQEFADRENGMDMKDNDLVMDDPTGNFDRLNLWNSETMLHNKSIKEVTKQIDVILEKLVKQGVVARTLTDEEEDDICNPTWYWGNKRPHPESCLMVPLSEEEQLPILMFHLQNLKATLAEQDQNSHCFLDFI
jgi:hypothetical protein